GSEIASANHAPPAHQPPPVPQVPLTHGTVNPHQYLPAMTEIVRDHHAAANQQASLDASVEESLRGYSVMTRLACMERLMLMQQSRNDHLARGAQLILSTPGISKNNTTTANERLAQIYLTDPIPCDYKHILAELVTSMRDEGLLPRPA
ncbi:hypothetical protein FRC10_004992, partial [Ceratobasidium sp. 414]